MAIAQREMLTARDYAAEIKPDWCPGCGDFGIINAVRQALAELQIPPHMVAIVSGIGCSGKAPHYISTYGFHTLHGRALPVATGLKLANQEVTVLAMGGDGDGYGIGAGYFVNTGRRNLDFTYVVFNNGVYGLTKGQASPTQIKGQKTRSMAEPAIQDAINPVGLALSAGYTFVARGYAMDPRGLAKILVQAIAHRGTSYIDVLQPCPVYNDINTMEWYSGRDRDDRVPRVYDVSRDGFDPKVADPTNAEEIVTKKKQALGLSFAWGDQIPIGVLYQMEQPAYDQIMFDRWPDETDKTTSMYKRARPGQDIAKVVDLLR